MSEGARIVETWLREHPGCRAAYVHAQRHDLWWEFRLVDSFRWQGHICRMRPALARQRMLKLCALLGLTPLLERPVSELTAVERTLADLAVALLPQPDLLVWEEASPGIARRVYNLCRVEGIALVTVGEAPGQPIRRAGRVAAL